MRILRTWYYALPASHGRCGTKPPCGHTRGGCSATTSRPRHWPRWRAWPFCARGAREGLAASPSSVAVERPSAPAPAEASRRFQVALSFPGEVRDRVEAIAEELASGLGRERVFYDRWYGAELARPDMDLHLQSIYKSQAELLVVVLCADYERKEWCGLEWRVVREMIKVKASSRIMYLRLDDAPIEGFLSIDGYLDIAAMSDDAVADAIMTRARSST